MSLNFGDGAGEAALAETALAETALATRSADQVPARDPVSHAHHWGRDRRDAWT